MFTCVYIASKMFFLLLPDLLREHRCKRSGTSKNDMLTHCLDTAQKKQRSISTICGELSEWKWNNTTARGENKWSCWYV